jgi:hypothetical protein
MHLQARAGTRDLTGRPAPQHANENPPYDRPATPVTLGDPAPAASTPRTSDRHGIPLWILASGAVDMRTLPQTPVTPRCCPRSIAWTKSRASAARRPGHHRRDRPGHGQVLYRRAPGGLGQALPAHHPVRDQLPLRTHRQGHPYLKGVLGEAAAAAPAPPPSSPNAAGASSNAAATSRPSSPSPSPSSSSCGNAHPPNRPLPGPRLGLVQQQPHRQAPQSPQPRRPTRSARLHRHHHPSRLTSTPMSVASGTTPAETPMRA